MTQYGNLKTVKFNNDNFVYYDESQFLMSNIENIAAAARLLSEASLELYLYFLANQNPSGVMYSPLSFSKLFNISYTEAVAAFTRLVDTGFLIQTGDNVYKFFEVSQFGLNL